MNSKRKKKMMAATMALASIVSAKSKINAALKADTQIEKKSNIATLNAKKSGKSLAPVFWSLGTIAAAALGGYLIYNFTNKNGKNPSDEQDPAEIGVDNTSNGSNTKKNQPKVQKKIWEEDPHGIIKFIKWYGGEEYPLGSCIRNSILNMFLNPAFIGEIDNFIKENDENLNEEGDKDLKKGLLCFKSLWEATRVTESQNHKQIDVRPPKNFFNYDDDENKCLIDAYYHTDGIYYSLSKANPKLFGNYNSLETAAKNDNDKGALHPSLLTISSSRIVKSTKNLDNSGYKLKNIMHDVKGNFDETEYFIGGCTLRVNDNHSVYAHFLYDENYKLSRVIIQDPNSFSNNNKDSYLREIDIKNMNGMLSGDKVAGWKIDKDVFMIRKDKFEQYKYYWSNKSLPREGIRKSSI